MGVVVFRCGDSEHEMTLSNRDVHLLDGRYFLEGGGWGYRKALGLDYVAGFRTPPVGVPLRMHPIGSLAQVLQSLLVALETQKNLLCYSYSYEFSQEPGQRHGGGCSGFRVNGYFGHISVRPSGYCDLTLSEIGANGRGRVIEVLDMRVRTRLETADKGTLIVHRRKASVGWFEELARVLAFLDRFSGSEVVILHR